MAATVLAVVDGRLTRLGPAAPNRAALLKLAQRARQRWIESDPTTWRLAPLEPAVLRGWIDALRRPSPDGLTHRSADRSLRDAMMRPQGLAKVRAELRRALADEGLDKASRRRLSDLELFARPAMVAEIWRDHRNVTVQHLIVGVVQWPARGRKATHFDRCDARTAHLKTGNTLTPGDYPVGRAFYARDEDYDRLTFFLRYFPTPRDRAIYRYSLKHGQADRWRELSKQTLARLLADREALSIKDMMVVWDLDSREVSRWVGPYLLAVDDKQISSDRNSHHQQICNLIASRGTLEAIDGIVKAIRAKRFRPLTRRNRWHTAWLAVLNIAARHPGAAADARLASLIPSTDALVERAAPGFDIGSVAAAALLMRHGQSPGKMGLRKVDIVLQGAVAVSAWRFDSPEWRGKVFSWWQRRKEKTKAGANPRPAGIKTQP